MFFDTCPVISCCVKSYAGVWLKAAEKKISDTLWVHDVPQKTYFTNLEEFRVNMFSSSLFHARVQSHFIDSAHTVGNQCTGHNF